MPENKEERHDTYIIPPNFIDTGSVFGGMFKMRNAIEAVVVLVIIGVPVLNLPLSLMNTIIALCLTALPVGILALLGVGGESLSSFILNFFKFLFNRRVIRQPHVAIEEKPKFAWLGKLGDKLNERLKSRSLDATAELKEPKKQRVPKSPKNEVAALKQQLREAKRSQKVKEVPAETAPKEPKAKSALLSKIPVAPKKKRKDITVSEYLPIDKIEHGIIHTKDGRYVKTIEIAPLNFLLRSAREQRNIIYSFISFLKISPVKIQFKVLTKKADINKHLKHIHEDIARETDERCQELQRDYEQLIRKIGSKEAVTRRFFIIFEYEPFGRRDNTATEAVSALRTVTQTAKTFLLQCGNEVLEVKDEDEFTTDVLYNILNRKSGSEKPLSQRITITTNAYGIATSRELSLGTFIVVEIYAPTGFILNPTPHYVTLSAVSQYVAIVHEFISVANEQIRGDIRIVKICSVTGRPLAGAVFALYKNGERVAIATTNEYGVAEFLNVLFGEFEIKEIYAPDGFVLSDKVVGVTVTENGKVIEIEFENRPYVPHIPDQPSPQTGESGFIVLGLVIIGIIPLAIVAMFKGNKRDKL